MSEILPCMESQGRHLLINMSDKWQRCGLAYCSSKPCVIIEHHEILIKVKCFHYGLDADHQCVFLKALMHSVY